MNISSDNQSQFELFPGGSQKQPEIGKPRLLLKDLTLSLENIIVVCIVFVMSVVLFFSFGVERGKKLVEREVFQKEMSPTKNENTTIIVQSLQAQTGPKDQGVISQVQGETKFIEEKNEVLEIPLEEILQDVYTIQVASFKLEKNAQREADSLKDIGYESFVVPKGNYSIVCVGKFLAHYQAKELAQRLKPRYRDNLVRRL